MEKSTFWFNLHNVTQDIVAKPNHIAGACLGPMRSIGKIAGLLGLPVNEGGLERALELKSPDGRDHAKAVGWTHRAFEARSLS